MGVPRVGVPRVGVSGASPFPNEISQFLGGHRALLHTMVEDLKAMVFVTL